MSAWLPSGAVPAELRGTLRGAAWSQWLRHPEGLFRATLLVAAVDVVATCRHLRLHPDAPDVPPRAASPAPPSAALPLAARTPAPSSPDPHPAPVTLAEALEGLDCAGPPEARFETAMGTLRCALYTDRAPGAVAGFVALARGRRDFWDAHEGAWVRRPFYDGTNFQYVLPARLVELGDPLRAGGSETGLSLPDENTRAHDRAGTLCLASSATGTNRGQLMILALPRPSLDGHHPAIGRCAPAALVDAISAVPAVNGSPRAPVVVRRVEITCGARGT
jgi:peptidyl-prolyl cis-trans isomerase A (cyclophilin A)